MKFVEQFKCHCGSPMIPLEIKQGMKETDDGMEHWVQYVWKCALCGNEVRSSNPKIGDGK